jgi:predicted phosphohydrolase
LIPEGEILILAGDIVPFAIMDKHKDFFSYISDHFPITYWIPGNHEYYYYDIANKCGVICEKIKENVILVNNVSIIHNELKLVFSTLWSSISPVAQWKIEQQISDFQVIKYNGERFSSNQFNIFHEESKAFLVSELNRVDTHKTAVVTHHVPTFKNYPEKYSGSAFNEAFAVELFDLITNDGPNYWIYGHHHHNTNDFTIGNTMMVTNQLGYVKLNEHTSFRANKCYEL